MFWRRRGRERTGDGPTSPPLTQAGDAEPREAAAEEHPSEPEDAGSPPTEAGPIELERDAPRPVAIQQAAEGLSRRGGRVLELFKEVNSSRGSANFAIYLLRGSEPEERVFVEVATGPWDEEAVASAARTASILRGSDHADATLQFLSAYPLPEEVRFFQGRSALALLHLDLVAADPREPEAYAEAFRDAANRRWGVALDYGTEDLPLIEELLTAALNEEPDVLTAPVLDPVVRGLGCYVGETLRRNATQEGAWRPAQEWGAETVIEFEDVTADPIGQARAYVENGAEDSVAFYAEYVLRELGDRP